MITYYLYSLSVIPLFASRACLPVFMTALMARFGSDADLTARYLGLEMVQGLPAWMTSTQSLIILGIMALLEILANKSPDLRALLNMSDAHIKGLGAFFLSFQLVKGDFSDLIRIVLEHGFELAWGQSLAYTWSFCLGWLVFYTARLRNGILEFLIEADEDDTLGLQALFSWMEDSIGFIGIVVVILLPLLGLTAAALAMLFMLAIRKYLEARDKKQRTACPTCRNPILPCAVNCPHCNSDNAIKRRVGTLGVILKEAAPEIPLHQMEMKVRRRCPSCGERLKSKDVIKPCSTCGTRPISNQHEAAAYLDHVKQQLPKTLGICAILGAIPIAGVFFGVIYYRMSLIAELRAYIPRHIGCMSRWAIILINLILISFQPFFIGWLTLPLMGLVNYVVYQTVLKAQFQKIPRQGFSEARTPIPQPQS